MVLRGWKKGMGGTRERESGEDIAKVQVKRSHHCPHVPRSHAGPALAGVCLDANKQRTSPDDGLGAEAPDGVVPKAGQARREGILHFTIESIKLVWA
jgi:hypothetical protein